MPWNAARSFVAAAVLLPIIGTAEFTAETAETAKVLFQRDTLKNVSAIPAVSAVNSPQTKPTLRSGIELVTVDVTVLKRDGEPLVELTPQNFTVKVDGVERRIVAWRLVRAGVQPPQPTATKPPIVPAPPERSPQTETGRVFVLVVDRDHIAAGEGLQMLDAGARFIDSLAPADRAAIWTIPPAKSGIQFSIDRDALKKELRSAVGTYRPPMIGGVAMGAQFNIGRDEAIEVEQGRSDVLSKIIARECPPDTGPAPTPCPQEVTTAVKTVAFDWRNRAQVTLAGLQNLIGALGTIAGPKQLVLITSGPVNTPEQLSLINDVTRAAADARVTIHALQVNEGPYQARTDSMRASPRQIDQTLSAAYFLAGQTGGLAITPVSGDVGFQQLARELSASYELAFEATPTDRDGKAHRIDVQVRGAGFSSLVRARKTFQLNAVAASTAPAAAPAPEAATPTAPAEETNAAPTPAPTPLGTDPADLTRRLADYVDTFEREFSAVVAEERYVQMIHPWRGNPKGPESEPMLRWQETGSVTKGGPIIARRQILSDLLMVQTRNQQWIAYRDVSAVDGDAVRDRKERVRDLFLSHGSNGLAELRKIAEESARYNLGNFRRNMNIPTATLSFMRRDSQWRYEFRRLKDDTVDGRALRVLRFVEKARPTLIGTANGGDIPIEGRVWMDAESGAVTRTELRFDRGSEKRVLIRVDFRSEPPLAVLVPSMMWEWYEGGDALGRIGGDKTLVECLATYANLRRFQVSTSEQVK